MIGDYPGVETRDADPALLFSDDPTDLGATSAVLADLTGFAPPPLVSQSSSGMDMLMDVPLQVSVELGRARMTIGDVMGLSSSTVIELDKLAGDPADIYVNGRRIARGEVVVVDEKFGVRVLEVVSKASRLASME